jgi:hypothetical protein
MKRLIITLGLIVLVYFFGLQVVKQITNYRNNASLIMSGVSTKELRMHIIAHYNEVILKNTAVLNSDAEIKLQTAYINDDTTTDVVVTVVSDAVCGSGGCITTIFLQDEMQNFEPVKNFSYAVKELNVENGMTNKMHDLSINGDTHNRMTWDGERYVLNSL